MMTEGQQSAPEKRTTRLDWIDALKGLGIISVVAAHVWTRGAVRDAIYAVHMPLFFILSGYTARHVAWRALLPASLKMLGVPFACFSLLLLGADFLIEGAKGFRPIFPDWQTGIMMILFATEKIRGPFTILWFIPCLFLARLIWNGLIGHGQRPDAPVIIGTMLLVIALAVLIQNLGSASPLGARAVPGALVMIWVGALWRQYGMPGGPWAALVLFLALATLASAPPLNMKQGDLGWPVISLVGAFCVVMMLAMQMQRLPRWAINPLASFGRASLVIMYVHVAFVHYLRPLASAFLLFLFALLASWALDRAVRQTFWTRKLLLGSD